MPGFRSGKSFRSLILAIAAAFASTCSAHAQAKTEVVTVDVRPGATMRYLGLTGAGKPAAAIVLLAGGKGALNLSSSGAIGSDLKLNFLIRTREQFAREGFYVVALDAASDRQSGMNGAIRLSPQHANDVGAVIAEIKKRTGLPVWLVGTSAGTLSAAGVAAKLASSPSRPDGVVLTSTMTTLDAAGHCGKSVYDAALPAIKAPVLIASHRDDGCECTPGNTAAGAKLIAALTGAAAREHKIFNGGNAPLSGPCDARAQHGFFGIEGRVVKAIADWVKSH
jgi:pimeloyl-ACP methyl ester carboxylesterase